MTATGALGTKAPSRRALVCDVGGQDGAYLARFLLANSYEVFGTSRDAMSMNANGLSSLGVNGSVRIV